MLHQDTTDKSLIVEEIVSRVTGYGQGEDQPSVREDVDHATREFDRGTMRGYCKALIEHLEHAPDDIAALDALMIVGFAYPSLMGRYKIQVVQEGRRLAHLLENNGDVDRAAELLERISQDDPANRGVDKDLASMMRRTGNIDRLVDRYVRRAEEAMSEGRRRDAITWLREILLLDRSRSDIARMIRDLQYEQREIRLNWRRRIRIAAVMTVVIGLAVGVVFRELHIQKTYSQLSPQTGEDREALEIRLANLDSLINDNPLWLGMFPASRERADLRRQVAELDAAAAEEAQRLADEYSNKLMRAEAARTRGLLFLEQRDFEGAERAFERALELAPADWNQRSRVEADRLAIAELTPEQIRQLKGASE